MTQPPPLTRVLLIAFSLGLAGCGGEDVGNGSGSSGLGTGSGGSGDGGSGNGGPGGQNGPVDIPEAGYCAPARDWSESATGLELEMLELVNAQRASGATCPSETFPAKEPFELLGSLQCAARMHTLDMHDNDFFSHTGSDGSGPRDRMTDAGFEGRGWAENIAAGRGTAAGALEQWMSSTSGHCENIMGNYRYFGVGYVEGGSRRHLWTQTFGN